MSSGTTNKISLAKARVFKAEKEALNKILFTESGTIEIQIDNRTTLYVDVEVEDCLHYLKQALLNVALVRNDKEFDNISDSVYSWLEAQINDLNHDRYTRYLDQVYQDEYEAMGGRFASRSYL